MRSLRPPWWIDLLHPLPLGAAAVLFLNDHALKGAGLLPGWLTGKLSDFAGLFVFPILVSACVRWGAELCRRPLKREPAIVWCWVLLTGALFAAMKVSPTANRWARDVLGSCAMDRSDLIALIVLVPSALWMLRDVREAPVSALAGSARKERLRALATAFAALACVATSAPKVQGPLGAPASVTQARRIKACAEITPVTCRYDAGRFVLRLSAIKHGSRSCSVNVGSLRWGPVPNTRNGRLTDAPTFALVGADAVLFGASGHLANNVEAPEEALVRIFQQGQDEEGPIYHDKEITISCRSGFGEDTQPPAEVAR